MTRSAIWLAALLLLALLPASAQTDAACVTVVDRIRCRWEFSTEDAPADAQQPRVFDLPVHERTLAIVVVSIIGEDNGWTLSLQREDGVTLSESQHPQQTDAAFRHMESTAHVVFTDAALAHTLVITPVGPLLTPSIGRFAITYEGERVPEGTLPVRAAADATHPHIDDVLGDVDEPAYDVVAAWFDDARLDDGLLDAHIALAALPADVPIRDEFGFPTATSVGWKLAWTIENARYYVEWRADPTGGTESAFSCTLRRETDDAEGPILAHPFCVYDFGTATLHATFAELSVNNPPDGVLFESPEARTRVYVTGRPQPDVVDDATHASFLFAPGGPKIWESLDNGALGSATPAWYTDPLSSEHIVDTVQIVGSIAALATFLVGLALVYRRRRQTSVLLARVDAVEDEGLDSSETLLKLGRLEQEFSHLFRKHRISDSQYQVLSQRIASVATRFALRRELGLDDGVPGEGAPLRKFSAKRN